MVFLLVSGVIKKLLQVKDIFLRSVLILIEQLFDQLFFSYEIRITIDSLLLIGNEEKKNSIVCTSVTQKYAINKVLKFQYKIRTNSYFLSMHLALYPLFF